MQISDADIDFLHTCVHKKYKKRYRDTSVRLVKTDAGKR